MMTIIGSREIDAELIVPGDHVNLNGHFAEVIKSERSNRRWAITTVDGVFEMNSWSKVTVAYWGKG